MRKRLSKVCRKMFFFSYLALQQSCGMKLQTVLDQLYLHLMEFDIPVTDAIKRNPFRCRLPSHSLSIMSDQRPAEGDRR